MTAKELICVFHLDIYRIFFFLLLAFALARQMLEHERTALVEMCVCVLEGDLRGQQ